MLDGRAWADGPWCLYETPSKTKNVKSHAAIFIADDMANIHNVILRGMNSIYNQAPYVSEAQDAADFLFFVHCWCNLVEFHHMLEEKVLFPSISRLAKDPGLFAHAQDQHQVFHEGIHGLHDYAQNTPPAEYHGSQVRALIKAFADEMHAHLADEVNDMLDMVRLESDGLMTCFKETEKAKAAPRYHEIYPLVFGLVDSSYEGNGPGKYPPQASFFMPYLVRYWMARRHWGSWRFLPCDFWGQPRQLEFVRRPKQDVTMTSTIRSESVV